MTARRRLITLTGAALLFVAQAARAEDVVLPEPIEPEKKENDAEVAVDLNLDIDLSNVVTSAAKGVTTVQEAPAIATVLTGEDIQRRGFREINQVLSSVPAWMETSINGNATPLPMVRGIQQAALLLRDGISMFDPWFNWPAFNRSIALETIKRVEMVTGPGGVLWGANSFLGIVNVISKDAEDVNGLEFSAGYGDGPGNKQDVRTYAMFGKTFLHNKLKIFQHVSFESYIGPVWSLPKLVVSWSFGPRVQPDPPRSWLLVVDGKYSFGPVSLYYSIPVGFMAAQNEILVSPDGRDHMTMFDRYAILEYKDRFFKDRLSIDAKGYYTQFVRDVSPRVFPDSVIFPPSTDAQGHYNPGGFQVYGDGGLAQRYGASIDADLALPYRIRVLNGVEVFNESINHANEWWTSPPNPGFFGYVCPYNADGTLVPTCPRTITNDSNRLVWAAYADAQWRPFQPLILDAGVRLQQAFGTRPYALTPLYSAAAVWNFFPGYHLKFNYATGFRPPVFNNTDSTHGGINWGANPHLLNENSQALQGEVNARVLRNVSMFRELEARAGYAYTLLDNLIAIEGTGVSASYKNSGKRSSHSVEAQVRVYIVGDHFVELGYTYLYSISSLLGYVRNSPTQWFTLTTSINVIKRMLDVNANLRVYGSMEDSNRFAGSAGQVPGSLTTAGDTNVAFDKLSPVALLQVGARLSLWKGRIAISAQVYNALNQRYWVPDAVNEIRPNEQSQPIPGPGINFFTSVTFRPY